MTGMLVLLFLVSGLGLPALGSEVRVSFQDAFVSSQVCAECYDTTRNVLDSLATCDLSALWSSKYQDYTVGYIGDDYERFRIRFLSVTRDSAQAKLYHVTGKTMARNNICTFSGTLSLRFAALTRRPELPSVKQGVLIGTYLLNETKGQKGAGILTGVFVSLWLADSLGTVHYDSLCAAADGFRNNSFAGKWHSHALKTAKTCNWGDFRIPFSEKLDIGVAEFFPAESFARSGWKSYIEAANRPQGATAEGETEWWK